ncbi:hypothetical protein SAMN02745116_02577 [Pilibacter termitis]|uniref:SpaA-like prealbumin fold domain-containing protein n=1 Tax=Pilibacter termitis TaxID=263852 RepID=A0A1T4REY3_9ENTE|nr:SpaA isopeptide-forming pilin-related protein [Pilibacter termitis]SKA14590.1 hypothetical protein SAMN02745116_02577 [Pilibacter termitis]
MNTKKQNFFKQIAKGALSLFAIAYIVFLSGGVSAVRADEKLKTSEGAAAFLGRMVELADPLAEVEKLEVDGKTVLNVPTETTDKELSELREIEYQSGESLITPYFIPSSNKKTKTARVVQNSDISIPKATIKVLDGTSQWDSDNAAGHDASASNNIVRSWDTISYLMDFSVQNENSDVRYTNIQYSVTAKLPNAITLMSDGKTPQVNGEVANGTAYNNDGTVMNGAVSGAGYSEGTVTSAIPNTGQIFLPIVVNTLGAPNGSKLQPTFSIKILSADKINEDGTTKKVVINETYTSKDFSTFAPAATTVSAKPSVQVKMSKGQQRDTADAQALFPGTGSSTNLHAWDIGVVTVLQPLKEHESFANKYVGSTYPTTSVSYTIKLKGTYKDSNGVTQTLDVTNQSNEMSIRAFAPALVDRSSTSFTAIPWGKTTAQPASIGSVPTYIQTPLAIPNAITNQVYAKVPPATVEKKGVGVFDSGTFSVSNNITGAGNANVASVVNTQFRGVYNPYTYDMNGVRSIYQTERPFSSLELIARWDKTKTLDLANNNKWSEYSIIPYIDQISFDGGSVQTQPETSIEYRRLVSPPGNWSAHTLSSYPAHPSNTINVSGRILTGFHNVGDERFTDIGYASAIPTSMTGIGGGESSLGNSKVYPGESFRFAANMKYGDNSLFRQIYGQTDIFMWNPSAFTYDNSRLKGEFIEIARAGNYTKIVDNHSEYGVAKNPNNTSPVTMKVSSVSATNLLYDWYDELSDVPADKVPSAIRMTVVGEKNMRDEPHIIHSQIRQSINLKVNEDLNNTAIAPARYGYPATPITVLRTTAGLDQNERIVLDPFTTYATSQGIQNGNYKPTTWDASGNPTIPNGMVYWNGIGDSYYIGGFNIKTLTDVEKSTYGVEEEIKIKVTGLLDGPSSLSYDSALTTTLPKGIVYKSGTAKDANGKSLPDPTITQNADGTTALRWVFPKSSVADGTEVNFSAISKTTQLSFNSSGMTASLSVRTVGEMWQSGNTNSKDARSEELRASSDVFQERLNQQLVLSKEVDKEQIEMGNIDVANANAATNKEITYTVIAINNSIQENQLVPSLKLLDVLPYDGDSRGSKLSKQYASYEVKSAKAEVQDSDGKAISTAGATLSYTTNAPSSTTYNEKSDPNSITGWNVATTAAPVSASAKGLLAEGKNVPIGGRVVLTVTLSGKDLATTDIFRNNARMNSSIDNAVTSQVVETKPYKRTLSGIVWEDADRNGLMESTEKKLENIPVKLYRTSLVNKSYVEKLVETGMTGVKFVDAGGESIVKTNANGVYSFDYLPEGNYIAEFQVGDKVERKEIVVTKPNVGSDEKINSKSSQTPPLRTQAYTSPILSEMPSKSTNGIYKMEYLNLGITPTAEVSLFKYKAGTLNDTNHNNVYDESEIKASTQLAGAEFEVYKGNLSEYPTAGEKDVNFFAKGTTDKDGFIKLTNNLFMDVDTSGVAIATAYTVFETKAPNGYELFKKPIHFEVTKAGEKIDLYVDDEGNVELPYTGGDDTFIKLVITSLGVMVVGMVAIAGYHFRRKKEEDFEVVSDLARIKQRRRKRKQARKKSEEGC